MNLYILSHNKLDSADFYTAIKTIAASLIAMFT